MRKLKSENVDVDFSGRPCKEKMAKVLCSNRLLAECTTDLNYWASVLENQPNLFQLVEFTDSSAFTDLRMKRLMEDYVDV